MDAIIVACARCHARSGEYLALSLYNTDLPKFEQAMYPALESLEVEFAHQSPVRETKRELLKFVSCAGPRGCS